MEKIPITDWNLNWLTIWEDVWSPTFLSEWKAWMEQSPDAHVFFEPSLVRAWFETYIELRDISPRFLIATHTSGTIFFLPLIVDCCGWKDGWLRVLRPVGFTEFDYHDPIVVGPCLADLKKSFWHILQIHLANHNQRADIVWIPRLREQVCGGLNGFRETNKAPFLNLSNFESFEDLISGLHKQLRQELRRQPRRLSALGDLEFYTLDKSEGSVAMEMLPQFLDTHTARWPQAYKPINFYESLIQNCLPKGILHISVLKSLGVPISWHIGFIYKKRFYYYVPAFDHRMATYSPGKVHLVKLIEEAMKTNIEVFDFLTGEEPYKLEWAKESIGLFQQIRQMPNLSAGIRSTCQKMIRNSARFFLSSH